MSINLHRGLLASFQFADYASECILFFFEAYKISKAVINQGKDFQFRNPHTHVTPSWLHHTP